MILVGVGVVVVLAIGGFVAKSMMYKSASVDYQQNLNGSQTYSNNEGSVTVGQNATMPSSWPADAPANYSGANIMYSGNSNPKGGSAGAMVSYTVSGASTQAVADYYKKTLVEKGWTVTGDANMSGQVIIGAEKDNRTIGISIADTGNGMITVTAGLEL